MRVLHVVQGYAPAVGGTEKVIQRISEELVRRHADSVTIYTTAAYNCELFWRRDQPSLPVGLSNVNGVTVRRFPVWNHLNQIRRLLAGVSYKLRLPFNDHFRALYNGPIIPSMTRAIAQESADIVAASSFPLLHMQYALRGGHRAGLPVVLIGGIHTEDDWGFDSPLIYRTLRKADHVVAYTQFERAFLVAKGVPQNQITVIGLGVDAEPLARADGHALRQQHGWGDDPIVAYVGQQVAHKRISTLISAMTQVWSDHPNARLLIAGSRTSFTPIIESLVDSLPSGWSQRVTFLHDFDESIKPELFSAIDILAYPSAHESFGLVLLEAWAAGRPVIACAETAPGSVVSDQRDGLLIRHGDESDLASALHGMLASPEWRKQMGQAGQQKVLAEHNWDQVARQFRSVYARTCERHAAR